MTTPRIKGDPLHVWDVREPDWVQRAAAGACEWAVGHLGQDVANRTYRLEFYLSEGGKPCVVLHQHAVDEDGRKRWDPVTEAAVLAEPVVQLLDELPPPHLLGK